MTLIGGTSAIIHTIARWPTSREFPTLANPRKFHWRRMFRIPFDPRRSVRERAFSCFFAQLR